MAQDSQRWVTLRRSAPARFIATNSRGAELVIGTGSAQFTPIELLLAAIASCTGLDVEALTSRRAEPDSFELLITADKVGDEHGNHLQNIEVAFQVAFPNGEGGDDARELLPEAVKKSHDRLCTVSRTVELGTPIAPRVETADG
jgi:putative redox protein